jgi:hypothetical protein
MAVAGRIDPTSTTGLSPFVTRFRKYPVSSIVSVPWVMTIPSTSGRACSSFTRRASLIQTASFMSWLPMLAICSPFTVAIFSIPGTPWMSDSTEKLPAL